MSVWFIIPVPLGLDFSMYVNSVHSLVVVNNSRYVFYIKDEVQKHSVLLLRCLVYIDFIR